MTWISYEKHITGKLIVDGSIESDQIKANTITADEIEAGTITATEIESGAITANEIAAGTITATQIASDTITANEIDSNTITASEIASGTITGEQIATDTISANKFSGATEENYFNYFDGQTITYNTWVTLHEFDMPSTELDLIKARSLEVEWDAYIYTGQTGAITTYVYLTVEVLVPSDAPSYRGIGYAKHDSYPVSGWQRIWLEGQLLNKFGAGSIGQLSSYRDYRNLRFVENEEQSERLNNGAFSGTGYWTADGGTLDSMYGSLARITQDGNADAAYFYQQKYLTSGDRYRFTGQSHLLSTATGKIHISTSTDIADAFYSSDSLSGAVTQTITTDFTMPEGVSYVYVIGEVTSTTSGDYHVFDNFSLKEIIDKTYVDVSTTGGQIVPTSGLEFIYHHPFSNAAGGAWAVIKEKRINLYTAPYYHYFNIHANAYLGIERRSYKCRIRAKHLAYNDTVYTQDGVVKIVSRMTGEQHES